MLSRTSSISGTGRTIAPNQLPNLKAWYKADALNLSNGASLTSWSDSSGAGNTLNTVVGTQTFTVSDSQFNNKPTVTFNKSGYIAKVGGVNVTGGSAAVTLYFVGAVNDDRLSDVPYEVVSWGDNETENRVQFVSLPFTDTYLMEFCNTSAGNVVATTGAPIIASYSLPAATNVGSQPMYINGTAGPLTSSTSAGDFILNIIPSEIVIGACAGVRGTTEHWLGGKVAEVMIYNSFHDTKTRRSVERYFSQKYGIVTV